MRFLILGASGMLGTGLVERLAPRHEVHAALRRSARIDVPKGVTLHPADDVLDESCIRALLADSRAEAVINAIGVVKQFSDERGAEELVAINGLFPHRLARAAREARAHLIHVSTDCVFSGTRGLYGEGDAPDPVDAYGMSKLLGEPPASMATTIRTSIIGLETPQAGRRPHGLIEWFLSQRGEVNGYRHAIFSGLTVKELSRVIECIAEAHLATGLWHVAAEPISKYDLLRELAARLPHQGRTLRPVDEPRIDRSLDGSAFERTMGYRAPSWSDMLDELAADILARENRSR